jgi:ferredoxin-type protein NapH
MTWLQGHQYQLLRRASQVGILVLFWLGAQQHLGLLTGNLSSARLVRTIPLSDPFAVLQILAAGQALSTTVLTGALVVLLFYLLVGGRSFCAWVCPLNMITDLAGWLRRRLGIRGQLRVARETRFWVMGMAIVLSVLFGLAAFEWLSPIAMLHRELIFGIGFGLLAVVGVFLLDLCVLRHGWCGSLCPLGAFYSLVGRLAILRIGFDSSRCDRCGDCVPICPEPQVIHFDEIGAKGFIGDGQCLNCARCLEVCPRGALSFVTRFNARPAPGEGATKETEVPMERSTKFAAWSLALLALVLMAPSEGQEGMAEVDDGVDVYFRDVDLGAMSSQPLALYGDADPGDAGTLPRAFETAPPQILHTVEDMSITSGSNDCLDCHHPDNTAGEEDAPIPESHFQAAVMAKGQPGEAMVWKVQGYKKEDDVAGTRFNCTMCHTPQAMNVKTPGSLFPDEKQKDGGKEGR